MKNLFITGASGFVGRRLLEKLAGGNFETIYCLTRSGEIEGLDPASRNIKVISGDVLDPETYAGYLALSDTVLHLAAITGKAKPEEYFSANAEGTRLLVHECERLGTKNFLYVSTIAVKYPDITNYFYAQSKKVGEDAVRASSLRYIIVRPTMVIGKEGAIWLNLGKLANAPFPLIFGRGETRIQPIDVDDLVNVIMSIVTDDNFENQTFDVGGPEIISFGDFIRRIRIEYGGKDRPLIHFPLGPLLKILKVFERYVYSLLPINSGQLSSFVYESVGGPNWLQEKYAPAMNSPREMVCKVIEQERESYHSERLNNECRAVCRYLLNSEPNEYVLRKYREAHNQRGAGPDLSSGLFERILVRLSRGGRLGARLVDSYTRVFCKRAVIRKKLILVLAILETTYPYCTDIDSVSCSSKAEFLGSMAIRTVGFAVLCMVSASVLAPLQVASGMASRLGAGRKR
jgi:NADH dehydrogenase